MRERAVQAAHVRAPGTLARLPRLGPRHTPSSSQAISDIELELERAIKSHDCRVTACLSATGRGLNLGLPVVVRRSF